MTSEFIRLRSDAVSHHVAQTHADLISTELMSQMV